MRLLLIEDDAALGEGIHQALSREGYTVDWIRDGSSALLHCSVKHLTLQFWTSACQGWTVSRYCGCCVTAALLCR